MGPQRASVSQTPNLVQGSRPGQYMQSQHLPVTVPSSGTHTPAQNLPGTVMHGQHVRHVQVLQQQRAQQRAAQRVQTTQVGNQQASHFQHRPPNAQPAQN